MFLLLERLVWSLLLLSMVLRLLRLWEMLDVMILMLVVLIPLLLLLLLLETAGAGCRFRVLSRFLLLDVLYIRSSRVHLLKSV